MRKPGGQQEQVIFSIQHFCLHDGPGIRSIVFFKGCPLRCVWCQNPESWSPKPELAFKAHLCIRCRACTDICPEKAVSEPGYRDLDRCRLCFSCVGQCPSGALTRFGVPRSVASIKNELRPEFPLFWTSGGGVTFSGGEPTLFPDFAAELAQRLRDDDIHVTLETCGQFILEGTGKPLSDLLRKVDLVLFDVKLFDSTEHQCFCGIENMRIKRNLKTLARLAQQGEGPAVWPRLPLIPGITDSRKNLLGWAEFLLEAGLPYLTLIPYHSLGESKRSWLGLRPDQICRH